jgi:chitodextrinase
MQSMTFTRAISWALLLFMSAGLTACTMDKSQTAVLSGPSEFGLSIDLSANPDVLTRDGNSQSVIRVVAFSPSGQPQPGKHFRLTMSPQNGGTLSDAEVVTGADGRVSALYTSAALSMPIQRVTIGATPIGNGGNFDNARTQTITISLRGANAAVPSFTFAPVAPKQFDVVTFDASGTTLDGAACQARCAFTWTFGTEGSETGEVATHRFEGLGTHTVTLTVTGTDSVVVTTRKTITVAEAPPPEAKITVSSKTPAPDVDVRFSGVTSVAKGGAKIVAWEWNFGNGETDSGASVTTSYATVGSYLVVLTVRDSNGQTHSATETIVVAVPAP